MSSARWRRRTPVFVDSAGAGEVGALLQVLAQPARAAAEPRHLGEARGARARGGGEVGGEGKERLGVHALQEGGGRARHLARAVVPRAEDARGEGCRVVAVALRAVPENQLI